MNDAAVWIHQTRARTAWYEADDSLRMELASRWRQVDADAGNNGAVRLGRYSIRGQSDYSTLEVWTFPSVDDVVTFWRARVATDYAIWFVSANQMGVAEPAFRSGQAQRLPQAP